MEIMIKINNLSKCNVKGHQQSQIIAFCLEENCNRQRKLCQCCIQQHQKHHITTLKTNTKNSLIQNFRINYKDTNEDEKSQINIDYLMSNLVNKCEKIINLMQKLKKRCFTNNIFQMSEIISGSFKEDGHCNVAAKITSYNITRQQLDFLAKAMRFFEKKHLRNINLLEESVKCMVDHLQQQMDNSFQVIQSSINKIQTSLKQWSVFEVQDYQAKLASIKKQKTKIFSFYEHHHKDFVQYAKKKQWKPIIAWVEAGRELDYLNDLKLNGNSEQTKKKWEYTITIHKNIEKIQNINILTNLKQLQLQCNLITKIENLDKLSELQILRLSGNLITNISNLENLKKLKELYFYSNQIIKIQNLQALTSLTTLDLRVNKIGKIQNLRTLTSLQSLGLGYNEITKIQNLQTLVSLRYLLLNDNPIQKTMENKIQAKRLKQMIGHCDIANH